MSRTLKMVGFSNLHTVPLDVTVVVGDGIGITCDMAPLSR